MERAECATLRHAAHRSSAGVGANDARPAADVCISPREARSARRPRETLARENAIATGRHPPDVPTKRKAQLCERRSFSGFMPLAALSLLSPTPQRWQLLCSPQNVLNICKGGTAMSQSFTWINFSKREYLKSRSLQERRQVALFPSRGSRKHECGAHPHG